MKCIQRVFLRDMALFRHVAELDNVLDDGAVAVESRGPADVDSRVDIVDPGSGDAAGGIGQLDHIQPGGAPVVPPGGVHLAGVLPGITGPRLCHLQRPVIVHVDPVAPLVLDELALVVPGHCEIHPQVT